MTTKRHPKQKTLGFLGTRLGTFLQNQLWRGAMQAAQEHQVRLVFYPTISQSSASFTPSAKVLFDFVDARYVDGLLIWYAGVAEGVGVDNSEHFFDRYDVLPTVTIGGQLKDHPDLSIDNYQGARAITDHLIEVHGRRHIGIIRGPLGHPDADERYRGYVEALQAHSLPVDPTYVAHGLFASRVGTEMARAITTRWLHNPNQKLDAIVAGSDNMAFAAVQAIEAHGLRVPEDIAVVGFDDIDISLTSSPSITTIRQPFYEMGYQATEMLFALIAGQSLPTKSITPAQLVVRESCGCTSRSIVLANTANDEIKPEIELSIFDSTLEDIPDVLAGIVKDSEIPIEQAKNLARLLQNDIQSGTTCSFLAALKKYLMQSMESHFDAMAWQDVISVLRQYTLSSSKGEIGLWGEALFNQARVLITEISHQAHTKERLKTEQRIADLLRTSEALITSFGRQLLMETIRQQVPELGFPGFYLSLYDDPAQPATYSHLILACENNQRLALPPNGLRFPTSQLIPRSLPSARNTTPIVVEPLYFREQQLGILVFEVGPTEGAIYENLRAQISSALQGSQLLQQTQNYATQLEQQVTERTEELTHAVNQLQIEITERQRAQEALAQERNLLRTLIDSMPDLIFAKDAEGRFILKNEADVHTMGARSISEVIGKTDFDYYPQDLAERFYANDQHVIRSGQALINHEEPGIDSEGNKHWLLTTKVPLRDGQGKVIGLVGIGRDITERKRAEEVLHETELKLSAALKIAHLGYWEYDVGKDLFTFNDHFYDIFRTTVEQIGGYAASSTDYSRRFVHPDDVSVVSSEVQKAVKTTDPDFTGKLEHRIIYADGDIGYISIRFFVVKDDKGRTVKIYGVSQDITERRRSEEEVRHYRDNLEDLVEQRTAELKAANEQLLVLTRLKDEFVSNVSHELRTPISSIKLRQHLARSHPEQSGEHLDAIKRETDRLARTIEDMLQLSRLDQKRAEFNPTSVDLNELVGQHVNDRAPIANDKNVPLTFQAEPGLPHVMADVGLLGQVLGILLTNAINYTPADGQILVKTHFRQNSEERWVGFSVSDTGPGIPPEEQPQLFARFFRGTTGRQSGVPGTGLGLAIAEEIVKRHDGDIVVKSDGVLGHGTTFGVWIPIGGKTK